MADMADQEQRQPGQPERQRLAWVALSNARDVVEDYKNSGRANLKRLDAALEEMDAGVFPTFYGGGMKQKIFEAICRGFPVLAPKKAIGGYPLKHQENI